MSERNKTFENVTNQASFQAQAFAQNGWRILTVGEDTDTKYGGSNPKETYRYILPLEDSSISWEFYKSKGDDLTSQSLGQGLGVPGLFTKVTCVSGTILVAIA